jgi:hypothetical protein
VRTCSRQQSHHAGQGDLHPGLQQQQQRQHYFVGYFVSGWEGSKTSGTPVTAVSFNGRLSLLLLLLLLLNIAKTTCAIGLE